MGSALKTTFHTKYLSFLSLLTSKVPNFEVTRRTNTKNDPIQGSRKLILISKIAQYTSLAVLLLQAGDVAPNPGWSCSAVNRPGLKVTHLNIRSLPKHLDELKILLHA